MNTKPTEVEFLNWRSPIRGSSNPEKMDNTFWKWCVTSGESAYQINQTFDGPDSMGSGPCWCFQRYGQAKVDLPDGRTLFIGGEHEDYYDPDFYIYNDVVVVRENEVSIFGYPETTFPPTDFHTATRVGEEIFLIGNLGYPDDRKPGTTQVLKLNIENFVITPLETSGENPGWIHGHHASLSESSDSISIKGGNRFDTRLSENFHDFELCLKSLEWKKTVHRNWRAWTLTRKDEETNGLWEIRSEYWNQKLGLSTGSNLAEVFPDLPDDVIDEMTPNVTQQQIEAVQELYRNPINNASAIEDDDCHGRYRLSVNNVTVRVDESVYEVVVTVEGNLPESTIETILEHFRGQLSKIEGVPYLLEEVNDQ